MSPSFGGVGRPSPAFSPGRMPTEPLLASLNTQRVSILRTLQPITSSTTHASPVPDVAAPCNTMCFALGYRRLCQKQDRGLYTERTRVARVVTPLPPGEHSSAQAYTADHEQIRPTAKQRS
jgi:hypothetical protein